MKYTLHNNMRFLEFTETSSGNKISINKETVKEIRITPDDPYLFLVYLDDIGDHRFNYHEVVDPDTSLPFTDLTIFRDYVESSLNDITQVDTVPLGAWDPNTNTPALGNGAMFDSTDDGTPDTQAVSNQYYLVSADGTHTLDGTSSWSAGDYVRSNGSIWVKIEASENIHASKVNYELTNVNSALNDIYSKLNLGDLEDTDIVGVTDGASLIYNAGSGLWVPGNPVGSSSGRTFLNIIGFVAADAVAPTTEGLYILGSGTPAIWVPGSAAQNDIIELDSGVWSVHTDISSVEVGEIEVEFESPATYFVNYIWDGSRWNSYNAYEPSTTLNGIQVANPVGDINGFSADELRTRSMSWILDTMFFTTLYTPPTAPTLQLSNSVMNMERGGNPTGTRTITFNQNDAGPVTEFRIEAHEGSGAIAASLTSASIPATVNLDNINGHDLVCPGVAESMSWVNVFIDYSDGPIPTDSKGNEHPGDQILADTISREITIHTKYAMWYGRTAERFTIPTGPESTEKPFIAPNDGSNTTGIKLDESWIRANLTTQLFTGNLNSKVVTLQPGDVHGLIVCPPGITVTTVEIFAAGSWLDWDDFEEHSFDLDINDAAGNTPRTYKVYYVRSMAADNFSAVQNFRFTTSGIVIP